MLDVEKYLGVEIEDIEDYAIDIEDLFKSDFHMDVEFWIFSKPKKTRKGIEVINSPISENSTTEEIENYIRHGYKIGIVIFFYSSIEENIQFLIDDPNVFHQFDRRLNGKGIIGKKSIIHMDVSSNGMYYIRKFYYKDSGIKTFEDFSYFKNNI